MVDSIAGAAWACRVRRQPARREQPVRWAEPEQESGQGADQQALAGPRDEPGMQPGQAAKACLAQFARQAGSPIRGGATQAVTQQARQETVPREKMPTETMPRATELLGRA
jgi:hypothetical protein